jgi:hypothetical protein
VVYGSTLRAYACMHGLLAAGVSGKKLVLVRPPKEEDGTGTAAGRGSTHALHEEKRHDSHPCAA